MPDAVQSYKLVSARILTCYNEPAHSSPMEISETLFKCYRIELKIIKSISFKFN